MKNYQRWNNILGWLVCIAACAVYIMTTEPTASWWDCGEYIATSYKLEVGHPPGAPTFQLIARIFTLFSSDLQQVAVMVNIMSAIASGFTILFLFWSINIFAKKIVLRNNKEMQLPQMLAIFGSGLVGAFAYTFSDTFWFSAVEGEVYAMSSFFTAIVFWAILKWEEAADDKHSLRWLILLAFLIGISIGVHLLNLLAIPAIAYIYYFRKSKKVTTKGLLLTGAISVFLLAFILYGLIPDIVNLFSKVEVFFVNSLGTPFNTGTIVFALTIVATLVTGVLYTMKPDRDVKPFAISGGLLILWILLGTSSVGSFFIRALVCAGAVWGFLKIKDNKRALNAILLSFAFLLMGYSTFLMLIIRSNSNTPINENSPKDAVSLLSYLNREQYGENPLFYGPYYTEEAIDYESIPTRYVKGDGKYDELQITTNPKLKYKEGSSTVFPRMYSADTERNHPRMYQVWTGVKTQRKPTFGENIEFFVRYQLNFMYWRYFMWNFVGRQNDVQGNGYDLNGNKDILHGNWISGVKFIDEARLGSQNNLPHEVANNRGHNTYYFLPLILGLIGLFFQYKANKKDAFIVFLLFFMTGLAIAIYLNMPPLQPRERDYAFAGSFYAFAIWIGLGVLALYEWLSKKMPKTITAIAVSLVCFAAVPTVMGCQNWDDHDRSGKTAAKDYAENTLSVCDKDAILITYGDNDTFPLWYVQEVENYRTDVRILNYTLAGMSWYVQQLFFKLYESDPLPFTLKYEQYAQGKNEQVAVKRMETGPHIPLKDIIEFVKSDVPESKVQTNMGTEMSLLPTNRVQIAIDKADLIKRGYLTQEMSAVTPDTISWTIDKNYIRVNELMLLDVFATNNFKRSIYIGSPYGVRDILPSLQYIEMVGSVFKITPYAVGGRFNLDKTYELFAGKNTRWGNLNDPKVYVDPVSMNSGEGTRNQYARFAEQLIAAGKKDSANVILDKGLAFFPDSKIPYDANVIFYGQFYAQIGQHAKAKAVWNKLIDISNRDLAYCQSIKREYAGSVAGIRQTAIQVLASIREMTKEYGDMYKDLNDKITAQEKRTPFYMEGPQN